MSREAYRYTFEDDVSMKEVGNSLSLAALAAEGIHGRVRITLDASFRLDGESRVCVIDGTTAVGQSIAAVFTEFLAREFGEDACKVKRTHETVAKQAGDRT